MAGVPGSCLTFRRSPPVFVGYFVRCRYAPMRGFRNALQPCQPGTRDVQPVPKERQRAPDRVQRWGVTPRRVSVASRLWYLRQPGRTDRSRSIYGRRKDVASPELGTRAMPLLILVRRCRFQLKIAHFGERKPRESLTYSLQFCAQWRGDFPASDACMEGQVSRCSRMRWPLPRMLTIS